MFSEQSNETTATIFCSDECKTQNISLGFIGFGEVTYNMAKGLQREGIKGIRIYTRAASESTKAERHRLRAQELGAIIADNIRELVEHTDIIISAVTGDVSLKVAKQTALFLRPDQLFADLNNAIPSIKKKSSEIIRARGARFVDISLLELPIQVEHKALMYVSGDGALEFKKLLSPFKMNIHYLGEQAGTGAMIKALVNVFMKGLQGVCLEFVISAQKAGIDPRLLEPLLVKPVLELPREKDVAFWFIRAALLAKRKTNEMKDVVKMLRNLDVNPIMLKAAISRMSMISQFDLEKYFDTDLCPDDYRMILAKLTDVSLDKHIKIK